MGSSSNSANKLMKEMQRIAADAQVKVQQLANEATQKSFDYNKEEAATARSWQKEMSDTAHQREVVDLKKAGLNPVLSANSGAQSYTTSSASAQANDPSASIGNLAGNLIQSRTNAYSADTSAAATRAAASAAASATRYAAAQQASAARYAAAMNYQTQKDSWKWKTDYMKAEYKAKGDLVLKTPVNSVGGVLDKFATKSGLYDLAGTNGVKNIVSNAKKLLNSPTSFFKDIGNGVKLTASNFKLNGSGKNVVGRCLNGMHVANTSANRNLFVKAFVFGNVSAQNLLRVQVYRQSFIRSKQPSYRITYLNRYR